MKDEYPCSHGKLKSICYECKDARIAALEAKLAAEQESRLSDLRSLKTLASMTGSLATCRYCDEQIDVLAARAGKEE